MRDKSETRLVMTKTSGDGHETATAGEQYHQAQMLVSEARGKFYDRVALLSGGAVVLSVSFLGSIAAKWSVHLLGALFCAWSFLVASLFCCIFRNPPFHKYVLHCYAFYYAKSMLKSKQLQLSALRNRQAQIISQEHEDGMAEYKSEAEIEQEIAGWKMRKARLLAQSLTFHLRYRSLEIAGLGFFFIGLLALAGFAVVNALTNPHQLLR